MIGVRLHHHHHCRLCHRSRAGCRGTSGSAGWARALGGWRRQRTSGSVSVWQHASHLVLALEMFSHVRSTKAGAKIDRHPPGPPYAPDRVIPTRNANFAATSQIRAPDGKLSAPMRALSSSGHRRRPVGPSWTSFRDIPVNPRTSIRCSFWCSTAGLPRTQLQDGRNSHQAETRALPHRLPLSEPMGVP